MDVHDLPEPVQKAVAAGTTHDGLVLEGLVRATNAGVLIRRGELGAAIQMLGIAQGYLTVALRRAEERRAA